MLPTTSFLNTANSESECKAEMMDVLNDDQSRKAVAELTSSADQLRARHGSLLRNNKIKHVHLPKSIPAGLGINLESYFANSQDYRRAWDGNRSKRSSSQGTHRRYRGHEPDYSVEAIATFAVTGQQQDQVRSDRSDILNQLSKYKPRPHTRRPRNKTERITLNHLRVLDWMSTLTNERLSRASSPPPPYTQVMNETLRDVPKETDHLQTPDMFSLLDHPPIAEAVYTALKTFNDK